MSLSSLSMTQFWKRLRRGDILTIHPAPQEKRPRRMPYRFTLQEVVADNRAAIGTGGPLGALYGSPDAPYTDGDDLRCAVGLSLPRDIRMMLEEDGDDLNPVSGIWMLFPDNPTGISLIQIAYDAWVSQNDPDDGGAGVPEGFFDKAVGSYGLARREADLLVRFWPLPFEQPGWGITPRSYLAYLDAVAAWDRSLGG